MSETPQGSRLHLSAARTDIAIHNEGFLEGVCHVIDELRAAGFYDAADAMMARLFRKVGEER